MEISAIREAVHRQPFEPFQLKMADGREISVRHPDFIALPPVGRTVTVYSEEGAISILESILIQSIELPATQQNTDPQKNGDKSSQS